MPKITGKNGEWEYTITDNAPPAADKIEIKFTPKKDGTGCKNIRLTQFVYIEAFDKDGKLVGSRNADIYKPPAKSPYDHADDDEVKDKDGHWISVDHTKCEKDPFYNGDDKPQDTPSQGDATTDPPKPTKLDDTPVTTLDNKKDGIVKIVKTFTTCAFCVTTGEFLGCISWKTEATKENTGQVSIVGTGECENIDPYKDAFKKFMENHTGKKPGETDIRYWCPESQKFGPVIPDGMKKYIDPAKVPERTEKISFNMPGNYQYITVVANQAGGAVKYPSLNDAANALFANTANSLVKFTWTGEQIKDMATILLSPRPLTAQLVYPYLENLPALHNDFEPPRSHITAENVLRAFGQAMLKWIPTTNPAQEKPVHLTIGTNIGLGNAGSFGVATTPEIFQQILNDVRNQAPDPQSGEALDYLGLNFGTGLISTVVIGHDNDSDSDVNKRK